MWIIMGIEGYSIIIGLKGIIMGIERYNHGD
jgi:hypothetical protein